MTNPGGGSEEIFGLLMQYGWGQEFDLTLGLTL